MNDTDLAQDHRHDIATVTDLISQDFEVRARYVESAALVEAIRSGQEPPINNMAGWQALREDLDNSQEPGLEDLKDYVTQIFLRDIREPWTQAMEERMRAYNENPPAGESRDNSQYEDSTEDENSESSESESFHTAETNQDQSSSESESFHSADSNPDESSNDSNSDDNLPANSDDESDSDSDSDDNLPADSDDESGSDSDSDDNPPGSRQVLNTNNNPSDVDNQSENNHKSNEGDNNSGSNPEDKTPKNSNESNSSSNDHPLTDDAEDHSLPFKILYGEGVEKGKSTIDFVLEKQQEEMPDIMDSDGGD